MLTKLRISVLLTLFTINYLGVAAQRVARDGYYALLQQGIVFNQQEVNVQPGIAVGYQYQGYAAGLSGEIDFIGIRSIQAGIDLRKIFALGKQRFTLFASPGLNFVVPTKATKNNVAPYKLHHQFNSGEALQAGAGILVGRKKNLLAGFYWSRKTYKETFTQPLWDPSTQQLLQSEASNKYEYNRLGIKLALLF